LQLEISAALVRRAARSAKARGAVVVLNAAPAPRQIDGLFDDIDVLVVNEQEIQLVAELSGVPAGQLGDLVQALPPLIGAETVCTAGADGVYAVVDDAILHVPAPTVVTADTTGAGDTFIGYLAASLLANPTDMARAMQLASHAAALAVTRSGAMESIPWRDEVFLAASTASSPASSA
jgi:ribokinase